MRHSGLTPTLLNIKFWSVSIFRLDCIPAFSLLAVALPKLPGAACISATSKPSQSVYSTVGPIPGNATVNFDVTLTFVEPMRELTTRRQGVVGKASFVIYFVVLAS